MLKLLDFYGIMLVGIASIGASYVI